MKKKNPLRKRILREISGDKGKYLVIFILMIATISFISGYLVADGSMIAAYNESFTKYNVEDGHFITEEPLEKSARKRIEKEGVTLYNLPYVEKKSGNNFKVRIFAMRDKVNRACLMNGNFPQNADEIAIDRMFADNNHLEVGDSIKLDGKNYRISGYVALSDYSALFENSNDSMFDAIKFGVGVVDEKTFKTLTKKEQSILLQLVLGEGVSKRERRK